MERSHNDCKLTTQTSRAVAKNFSKDKIKVEAPRVRAFSRVHDFLEVCLAYRILNDLKH